MAPLPEVSIEIVAARTDEIEHAGPFAPAGASILGAGFTPDLEAFYRPPASTAALRNFHLTNVYLDTTAMTLVKGGCKLKETWYMATRDDYDACRVREAGMIRLPEAVNHIHLRGFTNYYHWMAQALPTVDWSIRNLPPADSALLTADLQPWQLETLALLGLDHIPRTTIDPAHHYFIPRLDYSEFQCGVTAESISLTAQATFRRLSEAVLDPTPAVTKMVYVARTDTAHRGLLNEAEVIALLQSEGITAIEGGRMSIPQQINLFGKADAVIGPHGAGLTNVMFCRPGTIVYELAPRHYLNPCFARLAQAGGLTYMIDLFGSGAETADVHDRTWTADLDVIRERIAEIKQRVVQLGPRPVAVLTPPAAVAQDAAAAVTETAIDYLKGHHNRPPGPSVANAPPAAAQSRTWLSRLLAR